MVSFDEGTLIRAAERARAGPSEASGERDDATVKVLTHVAESGASGLLWADGGLRDVFVAEVTRVLNVLVELLAAQHAAADNKALGNQARHDNKTLLEEFHADNEYILTELRSLPKAPFTSQRLAELLLHPFLFHTRSVDGELASRADITGPERDSVAWQKQVAELRPLVLQNAIRKCAIVTPTGVA
jgi:hypothetical protein